MRVIQPHGRFGVLIVTDDEDMRRWLQLAAEESELFWSVEGVADGRFALEHIWTCIGEAKRPVPDIVITDFKTPGLSGVQLTRELRRYDELKSIYIAFVVSEGGPIERDAAETAGADYFVRRPQSADELISILQQIVKRCSSKSSVPARMLH